MESLELSIYKRYRSLMDPSWNDDPENALSLAGAEPRSVALKDIVDDYDAFCFDGYGTLYNRGDFVYPMAREWYDLLRSRGKAMRLVTNAASNTDDMLAADAAARGFAFTAEETISSGSLLEQLLLRRRDEGRGIREVYYIGRATGVRVLHSCGVESVEDPESPVVAVSSATADDAMFGHAVDILRRPGGILLVLNSDAWAPNIDGSRSPVSGALAERLRLESGCAEVHYFGKPFSGIFDKVKASLPAGSSILMVGDTLGTDVMGARYAGMGSALVVGRNEPAGELADDERALKIRPDYYLVG